MTPLLKPLLDYKRVNGRPEWQNSDEPAKAFKTLEKGPRLAGPEKPKLIDLQEWARFLQNSSGGTEGTSQSAASNILAGLSEFDAQFKELQEAIKTRPEGRWPVRYDENFACLLPHLAVLKSMVLGCTLRAAANLENHNPSAALEDATIGLALGDSIRTEPILISHLVRAAITSFNVQAVREGLARRNWTDEQLLYFQNYFSKMNFLAELKNCLRGERAFSTEAIEMARLRKVGPDFWGAGNNTPAWFRDPLIRFVPRAWFEQNIVNILRFHDQYSLASVDENALRIDPRIGMEVERSLTNSVTPYNVLSHMLLPAVSSVLPKTARTQTVIQQTVIACALERYYRAHQQYPDKLQQLVPQYLSAVPRDVMDGAPMRYRRETDGSYLLYSIGWNLIDDGGTVVRTGKSQVISPKEGDWIWRLFGHGADTE
jgi:hypothetical protein